MGRAAAGRAVGESAAEQAGCCQGLAREGGCKRRSGGAATDVGRLVGGWLGRRQRRAQHRRRTVAVENQEGAAALLQLLGGQHGWCGRQEWEAAEAAERRRLQRRGGRAGRQPEMGWEQR